MNDNDTTFTIERYQKLVVEAGTHRVETSRFDMSIRIICTDRHGARPVVALVATSDGDYESVYKFSPMGENADFQLRIVPISPKSLGWVGVARDGNGYGSTGLYPTRYDLLNKWPRAVAIHEFFEGEGL